MNSPGEYLPPTGANLPQTEIEIKDRKSLEPDQDRHANIESTAPDLIAAGNIGCITQIAAGTALPVVHTAELLDWATGELCSSGNGTAVWSGS